jgi:glycerol-3-phosphate dehydrogenase
MRDEIADLLIIGGGVNGVGLARDAAGRGLDVMLAEQGDLASATSSASSKLIHGGLRYLEQSEFRLVRASLAEREVLLRAAPHLVRPQRFVLPHHAGMRPAWMLRAGLFLYDHLYPRRLLPGTRSVRLREDPVGAPLQDGFARGFEYSDCCVDDSRLVVLAARDAAERGADLQLHTRVAEVRRIDGVWEATLQAADGSRRAVRTRALVNAAGPWVDRVARTIEHRDAAHHALRLVKGSHIVVPRLYAGPQAYTLQTNDQRIVFVIPYEERFTLIGTTDVPVDIDPGTVAASEAEIRYLCTTVSAYLRTKVAPSDVVWTYAGIRPLIDDGAAEASTVTRDYVFELDAPRDAAPALTIYGGKLTTFRRLAEHALEKLLPAMGRSAPPWTASAKLPGGEIENADFAGFAAVMSQRYAWLPAATRLRMLRAYGTRIDRVLGTARALSDLGETFGAGLSEAELDYLRREEWAASEEDALWRRSKLGLHLDSSQRARVATWFG